MYFKHCQYKKSNLRSKLLKMYHLMGTNGLPQYEHSSIWPPTLLSNSSLLQWGQFTSQSPYSSAATAVR